jgi:hypothetical protein
MITLNELQMSLGSEYDFATSDTTTISTFTVGDWSGSKGDFVYFNSEDGTTATIVAPTGVLCSYAVFQNINNIGPTIYADYTCLNNGNNTGIVFLSKNSTYSKKNIVPINNSSINSNKERYKYNNPLQKKRSPQWIY